MINPIRSLARVPQHPALFPCNNVVSHRTISVSSFRQASEKMNQDDTTEKQQQKQPDVKAHSFGEGYATRSDEEGFGGTCASALDESDAATKIQQDKMIHENHPVYDKTQGSEMAEKEKGRHQKTPC